MNNDYDHIVKAFGEELTMLENGIAKMGELAKDQFSDALSALVHQDSDLSDKVLENDGKIDSLQEEVDRQILRILALRHPHADDLRAVIASLKVASTLERIGDYAKNIAKRATALIATPHSTVHFSSISRMGNLVQTMIRNVLDAYFEHDINKAADVRNRDEEVDQMHTSLFRELLTYMMEDPRNISSCTHLLFVAKNMERIGDHATFIAEQTYFLVKGTPPKNERPKNDTASYTVVKPKKT